MYDALNLRQWFYFFEISFQGAVVYHLTLYVPAVLADAFKMVAAGFQSVYYFFRKSKWRASRT